MRQVVFIPFILISASKKGLTVNENHQRSMEAQAMLRASNADFANVTGVTNGIEEKRFMIFGEKAVNLANDLAKVFDQESYIVKDKVNEAYQVSLTGEKVLLGRPRELDNVDDLDNYLVLPQLDGSKKFAAFFKEH